GIGRILGPAFLPIEPAEEEDEALIAGERAAAAPVDGPEVDARAEHPLEDRLVGRARRRQRDAARWIEAVLGEELLLERVFELRGSGTPRARRLALGLGGISHLLKFSIILIIGRNSATTMVPMMRPSTTIMSGSSRLISDSTRTLTSSS